MQRYLLLLTSLFIIISANAEIIEKKYTITEPSISQLGEFDQIKFEGSMLTAIAGQPALPYFSVSLMLPPGEKAVSIEFIGLNEVDLEGDYSIRPYQASRPLSHPQSEKFYYDEDIYASSENFPSSQCASISTNYMNGYGFAFSSFTPVRYNPIEGKVSYYKEVVIKIETEKHRDASSALANLSTDKSVLKSVKSLAQNSDFLSLYPEKKSRSEEDYDILIITPQQFENDFDELMDIYLSRGLITKIFTKEYILQNITGQDLPEKIRNFIINEYQESGIEYVLLGGDVEHIPHRGFYCYVESGSGYTDYGIPSDLYYSALDGNWNTNGDNKWGESDEDDLLPEIAVGRFPFSDLTELNNLLNKTISYQNSPVLGEFQNPILVGENLYSGPDTWGKDYLDLIIGEHDDNGYTTTGIPEDYNYETMYEYDASWSGSDLINEINEGRQFIHHVGHANNTYVAHLSNGDITNSNFYATNGVDHNFTLMQTHGCDCGAFDVNDCILERMVNIENFAVAVIGNSRYGWFNEGQTEGPAAHLHREMVDAMFTDKIAQLGRAFVESKIQTAPWVEAPGQHEEGALRWNFYDINILGDPVMSVWNDEPIDVEVEYPEEIALGTVSIDVNVSLGDDAFENFSCTLLKEGEMISTALTDENGLATLVFDPVVTEVGEALLIVSGYNCLPDTSEIIFIAAGQAYVVYAESVIGDENGNSLIECGELISLDLAMENVGEVEAIGVNTLLISDNEWIVLGDTEEEYGDIMVGESVMKEDAFSFTVADNVPDQTILEFEIESNDGVSFWYSEFEFTANAPSLESELIGIDDTEFGNANHMLDAGETALLSWQVLNSGHSIAADASTTIICNSPYVTIDQGENELGDIDVDGTINSDFTISISESAPIGTSIEIEMQLVTGAYTFTQQFYQTIGLLIEDFETGDFSSYDWINTGDQPWIINDVEVFDGLFSTKSGDISDSENSDLMISLEVMSDDEITFSAKTSSEADWDYLRFYIDVTKMDEWSGEVSWQEYSYPISAGTHILKWSYEKDSYQSDGSDCGWLDNIVFPAAATILAVSETAENELSLYPNPSNGIVNINSTLLKSKSQIRVYNIKGSLVLEDNLSASDGNKTIDLSNANKGIYFIQIKSTTGFSILKLVLN